MPFLQRTVTPRSITAAPNRALDIPVADSVGVESRDREGGEILADAKICTPNNRSKDNDEEESIVKAVCLSSLAAEEKYDVEAQVYLTDSSLSVDDTLVIESSIVLESSTPPHQEVW